jgi:heme/copper-type cytochrome/quinol oxidase subunit 1
MLTVIPMIWLGYCGQPRRVLDYPHSLGGWHAIASAGHLLSVAALISFFFMIYDSIRQAKPTVRNTFGAGRLNTRISFYFFEINRLSFIQRKNFHHFRFFSNNKVSKSNYDTIALESLDTTLFSYRFFSNK